jgi:hypothetical protein
MEGEAIDGRVLSQLRFGAAYILEARSGVPAEDLHQCLYLQAERAAPEQTARQLELVGFLEGVTLLRALAFKTFSQKREQFGQIYGLVCGG